MKYPRTKSEDVVFRENFWSTDSVTDNGGTIVDAPTIANGVTLNGTSQNITYGESYNGIKTVSIKLKATTTSEDILDLDGGTHTIEVTAGTITATGFAAPTIYVDGVVSSTLDTDEHVITITTATAFDATALDIGHETTYFEGTFYEVSLYNKVKAIAEIVDIVEQDAFTEIDDSKAIVAAYMRSSYSLAGVQTTDVLGSHGTTMTVGDGTTASTFPTLLSPKGMSFDGGDYLQSSSITEMSGDFNGTLSCLVKFNDTTTDIPVSLGANTAVLGASFGISTNPAGAVGAFAAEFNSRTHRTAAGLLKVGKWYHRTVTKAAGLISTGTKLYLNGDEVAYASTPAATTPNLSSGPFNIGMWVVPAAANFNGSILTARLHNFVLTPTQVKELANRDLRMINN